MNEPLIDSRAAFSEAIVWGLQQALDRRARRIVCADTDFAAWPWDRPDTLQALTAWLRLPQRRLDLLARSYERLPRHAPRFTAWRRDWSHAVQAWQLPQDWSTELPCVLVADSTISVHLMDAVHWRGQARLDERAAAQWLESLDVVLQRSEPAWPVQMLGL